MSFSELGLHPFVLKALESAGYTEPTPVQAQAVPAALAGADLLVSSQTGSGKTAAFLLPSLHRLAEPSQAEGMGPRILVLTPTRELAQQVEKAARTYGKELRRLRTATLVGGSPYGLQLKQLSQPVDIVVATPGRLMDHMERGRVDFSRLEVLVLDEADRMLDMGFIDDIQAIVAKTPDSRQTLLFSATLDGTVGKLARELTRDPQRIEVAAMESRKGNIEQRLHFVDDLGHKNRVLDHLLRDAGLNQAVVFTATKRAAEELTETLCDQGYPADALHGDMPQHKRNKTLQRLHEGRTRVLVATDVAARGIDVAGISHVINFDPPRQAEDYVHRIGRTGRAGRSGIAITLADHRERHVIRNIERYTGEAIAVEVIPGLEPTARPPKPTRPRSEGGKWGGKPGGGRPYGGQGFKRDGEGRGGYGQRSEGQGGYRREGEGNFRREGQGNFRRDDNFGNRADDQGRAKSYWDDHQPRHFDRDRPAEPKRSGEYKRPFEHKQAGEYKRPFDGDRPARRPHADGKPADRPQKAGDPAKRADSWKGTSSGFDKPKRSNPSGNAWGDRPAYKKAKRDSSWS